MGFVGSQDLSWQQARQILAHARDVIILLSRDRSVQFANHAAERLLSRRDSLRLDGKRLGTAASADVGRLERVIDKACVAGGGGTQILVVRRRDSPPLVLTVRCLDADGASILLLGTDPCIEAALVFDSLRHCFGLTMSESQVAAAVAAGTASERIAAERGVSVNTVRSQIKSIACKLGCTTKSQISAIVRATPLSLNDPE
ncbi:MAG TPA: LuxR C-terminal-related transcriptional regulator [Sphingomicrobium sp.]|nr:LuxR C-terminal-related transcriptional regulator [Sphingomicrobium sp.]